MFLETFPQTPKDRRPLHHMFKAEVVPTPHAPQTPMDRSPLLRQALHQHQNPSEDSRRKNTSHHSQTQEQKPLTPESLNPTIRKRNDTSWPRGVHPRNARLAYHSKSNYEGHLGGPSSRLLERATTTVLYSVWQLGKRASPEVERVPSPWSRGSPPLSLQQRLRGALC